jgi:hypothetical protein
MEEKENRKKMNRNKKIEKGLGDESRPRTEASRGPLSTPKR